MVHRSFLNWLDDEVTELKGTECRNSRQKCRARVVVASCLEALIEVDSTENIFMRLNVSIYVLRLFVFYYYYYLCRRY